MSQQTLTTSPPVTVRVARWSATHPWRAIALWLVFVSACVVVGGMAGQREINDDDTRIGQSGVAADWFDQAGFHSPDTENVLVTARSGSLDLDRARAALAATAARMQNLPVVTDVGAPVTAKNRKAMTVQITVGKDADVDSLQAATAAVQRQFPALRVEEVGSTSLNDAINTQVADDLSSAATFSLPVTLVILLIAFGAIVAAGVPILLALSAVAAATGLAALVSHLIPSASTVSSMILLMGMAVGVDYSLFYVRRARAERHRGRSQLDAVEIAAETAGHSVLVSGLAVIVAMCGLYLTADPTFASLATGSIIVVAVAVLGSLTVLPALLVKLGRTIDRPRVPVLWRLTAQTREPRLWPAMLRPALNHPGRTLAVSAVVLGLLALPALGMTLHSGSQQTLPNSIAEKRALDRLTAAFPDQHAEMRILVKAPAAQAGEVSARLSALADRAAGSRLFLRDPQPRVDVSADRTIHMLTIDAPFDAESAQAHTGLSVMRDRLAPAAVAGVPSAHFAVDGDTASSVDGDNHLSDRLPWVVAFVVLLTMLIMGWVFRSVTMALTTAVVNLLSAGAAFGVLVLVFQDTWAESLLGFHSTGALINWIPLFTFAVLFGLSMDYHVFVVSRIKEAVDQGLSTREAIRVGITESAGTVTSAAVVMVSVFAIFAALHMVEMKEIGIGLAVAVLIDALVVRVIVLPSLMMLLGRWNWWPGRRGLDAPAVAREPVVSNA